MTPLRILSAADVRQALPMADAIASQKRAFAELSTGTAVMPLRTRLPIDDDAVTLLMPAYLPDTAALGVKLVSVYPQNPARGLPFVHAAVLAIDPDTGRPLALLEGGALTAIRTGAGAGAATDLLARPDATSVAIIGSGVQARTQLEAVCTVRRIERVWVFSPTRAHAEAFAAEMAGQGPVPDAVEAVDAVETAVAEADIVCAATTSSTPVFPGAALKPGAHVNGVGSYLPTMQEIDLTTIKRSLVVVDSREAVLAEAGDLIVPLEAGEIDAAHIHAEVGEIVNGRAAGRTRAEQITFFKSVGVAVQDAAAAAVALRHAERLGLGTAVAF